MNLKGKEFSDRKKKVEKNITIKIHSEFIYNVQ